MKVFLGALGVMASVVGVSAAVAGVFFLVGWL